MSHSGPPLLIFLSSFGGRMSSSSSSFPAARPPPPPRAPAHGLLLLPLLLLLSLLPSPAHCLECYSCASEIMLSQWQSTGLPVIPPADRFYFTDNCDKSGAHKVADCAGSCMEMLLVAGRIYSVVRGCLTDFYLGYSLPNITPRCYFGDFQQNVTLRDTTSGSNQKFQLSHVTVGARYCNENNCNDQLDPTYDYAVNTQTWLDKKYCEGNNQQFQTSQCISCSRFDWTGDCNWDYRSYCEGPWCTKTVGYVNGRWVEARGCAPFNPASNQICIKAESQHEFSQLSSQNFEMPYSLEQCFCQGARCNGAIGLRTGHSTSLPPFLLTFLLLLAIRQLV